MSEEAVSITTPHGQADGYLYRPGGQGPWPGVLFFTVGSGIRSPTWARLHKAALRKR